MKAAARSQASRVARRAIPACIFLCATLVLPVVATGSAAPSLPGPRSEVSLVFPAATARLIGSTALVPVKCLGPRIEQCTGTVTLSANGHKHNAPFALVGGTSQSLAVPVDSSGELANRRAVAVARTLEPAGSYARSSGVLRFR